MNTLRDFSYIVPKKSEQKYLREREYLGETGAECSILEFRNYNLVNIK